MNPLSIIAVAASLVLGVGLMSTQEAEVDTWGIVPASTAYPQVEADTPPDAPQTLQSDENPYPLWTGPGCREWADLALRSGFAWDDLWIALQVMELESMCLPSAIGDNGQSYGLMQINSFWCQPSRYWPRGYLQTKGLLDECQELMNPETNLFIAWHIATHHGWHNWTTYRRIDG
jgi:hypothetical protein